MCPHQFSDAILNGTRARRRAFDGIEFAGAVGVLFEVECGSHSFFCHTIWVENALFSSVRQNV